MHANNTNNNTIEKKIKENERLYQALQDAPSQVRAVRPDAVFFVISHFANSRIGEKAGMLLFLCIDFNNCKE